MAAAMVPSIRLAAPDLAVAFPSSSHRRPLRSIAAERVTAKVAIFAIGSLAGPLRGGGAGVLEKPKFDRSQFDEAPQLQEGGDIGRLIDKKRHGGGESYRVLLVDDSRHTEKLVEKALPEIVPSVSASQARDLFHESRNNGVAIVIVTVKEHAEFYSQMMVRKGLRSAIEPDESII